MKNGDQEFDAIILGAGFSGMYMLHLLREKGISARVYETGSDVGGTWYWNRYPGAGCDVPSMYYCYTFSEEIYKEWSWSSRLPKQEELLEYARFVADKLDLRKDIQFNTKITSAHFNEETNRWQVETEQGEQMNAKYFIPALGSLSSATNLPNMKGIDKFKGELYHTGSWPHEKVEYKGKKVGVIGTGSSGVQAIPVIAKEAEHLTVFQRTPQYVFPAKNDPDASTYVEGLKENFKDVRLEMDQTPAGFLDNYMGKTYSAMQDSSEERHQHYDQHWNSKIGWGLMSAYSDITTNDESNETLAEYFRYKIKEIVKDPEVANKLLPNLLVGARRPILGHEYYETFNRENVSLVDVKEAPITELTAEGIRTAAEDYDLDMIVFATGFDGLTGGLLKIDIRGRDEVSLQEKWDGLKNFKTNLGLAHHQFPNMFTLWGPHSSALFNALRGLELNAEWTAECIAYLEKHEVETFETTSEAENQWTAYNDAVAEQVIQSRVDSWYHGTNVEGKPRTYLMYFGDFPTYKAKFEEIAARGYEGFHLTPAPKVKVSKS